MVKMVVAARLEFNNLPQLRGQLRQRASQVVRKTALDILANAEANLPDMRGRGVDTGNLKNSYQPGASDNVFEMQPGDTTAVVGTSVEYAPPVEFGTSKMAPIPHLIPAVEKARPSFEAAMRQLVD